MADELEARKTRKVDPEEALNTTGNYGVYTDPKGGSTTLYNRDTPEYRSTNSRNGEDVRGPLSVAKTLYNSMRKY